MRASKLLRLDIRLVEIIFIATANIGHISIFTYLTLLRRCQQPFYNREGSDGRKVICWQKPFDSKMNC